MNLFEQENYKVALNSLADEKRKSIKGFSRKLAEYLNVHPTLISQILNADKDFTEEQMLSVCEFMGIAKLESQYLLILLQKERAGSKKLKDYFDELKLQIRKESLQLSKRVTKDRQLTEAEKAIFYSNWTYSAVQLLSTLEEKITFERVCEKLNLAPQRAREILDFLKYIQLVKEENGNLKPGAVSTHLEKSSPFLIKHHTNWRLKAIQAAENLSDQELMYTANFSISEKDFSRLREELVKTIQKFLTLVKDSPGEQIAQFNMDLFFIKP